MNGKQSFCHVVGFAGLSVRQMADNMSVPCRQEIAVVSFFLFCDDIGHPHEMINKLKRLLLVRRR